MTNALYVLQKSKVMYVQVYLFQVVTTLLNLGSWVPQNLWPKLLASVQKLRLMLCHQQLWH